MAGAVSSSSSDIVHDPMRVSRTVCVCVAECVDNSREQVHICIEVAINRVLGE